MQLVQRLALRQSELSTGQRRNGSAAGFEWSAEFQPVAEIFSNLHANEWCEIVMNYVMESYVCIMCVQGQQGL